MDGIGELSALIHRISMVHEGGGVGSAKVNIP